MRRFGAEESKVPYFEAGLEILSEQGPTGLKLIAVCAAMDVTTGGFYYYFRNLRHYIDELLLYWLEVSTTTPVEEAMVEADLSVRLRMLIADGTHLPHRAEAAIRSWAFTNPSVSAVVEQVDSTRSAVLVSTLRDLGLSAEFSRRITEVAQYLLIGFESKGHGQQDSATLRWGLELLLGAIEREAKLTVKR